VDSPADSPEVAANLAVPVNPAASRVAVVNPAASRVAVVNPAASLAVAVKPAVRRAAAVHPAALVGFPTQDLRDRRAVAQADPRAVAAAAVAAAE
jgi:hypothetical protein